LSAALIGGGSTSTITGEQADAAIVNLHAPIKNRDDHSYAEDGGAIDFAKGAPRGGSETTNNNFVPFGSGSEPPKN
jgi:hypothetical protein